VRCEDRAGEALALPEGEVGVLDRRLGKRRTRIESGEIREEEREGPVVGRDVMEEQEEAVLGRRAAQSRARTTGPCSRSMGRRPSSFVSRSTAAAASSAGRLARSTTRSGTAAAAEITRCTGRPEDLG